MDRILIETPLGVVPLVGRIHAGSRRPALLAVGGIFPPQEFLHDLVDALPEFDVVVGNIPGMRAPLLNGHNYIGSFSTAYESVLERLFPGQPVAALGVSTGALITLGLRTPLAQVAVEPFFRVGHLEPLVSYLQGRLREDTQHPRLAKYMLDIFGVSADAVEDRDYSYLLEQLRAPAQVLVATVRTPRWDTEWPSLTDDKDRAALASHPKVTLLEGPPGTNHAGFNVSAEGKAMMLQTVERALRELA